MSKGIKILLIIVGILAFLAAACVGGIALIGYKFVDSEGIARNMKEGAEFGRTTDNFGCQTKIVPMIKALKETDITEGLNVAYYFDSCLEASRPNPEFCDGVANPFKDILNEHKGKDAE